MKLRSLLRPLLGRERTLWRALAAPQLRYRCFRDPIDAVIFALLISQRQVFFIQIGSNDGKSSGDPLWTFRRYRNWGGLLVEPVDYVFRRLVQNYAPWQDRFRFENAAITQPGAARLFHYFAESDELAPGYDKLGSFDRELLQKHAGYFPGAETKLVSASVNCLSWEELCRKHDVRRLDLLHIDAEGADLQIIEQIDFSSYHPAMLLYEHMHLAAAEQQRAAQTLERAGYEAIRFSVDTLAVRRASLDALTALAGAWRIVAAHK